jgi:hypothetical protein
MFQREDWTLFRNLNTLSQKAGVPLADMRALVLKEIMDNALDAAPGKKPEYGHDLDGWYWVHDLGAGIPGTDQEIADLFSIRRPLTSTKILRLPSRGALGNGIRVIAGAILASGGALKVATRGRQLTLKLHDDGITTVEDSQPWDGLGTKISVLFGIGLKPGRGGDDWHWARTAANFSFAHSYQGKSSPWWYDSDSWYELLQAAGGTALTDVLLKLDGFTPKGLAAILTQAPNAANVSCEEISREGADTVLRVLREHATEVSPKKIGRWVDGDGDGTPYARKFGVIQVSPGRGALFAKLPFCIEALCTDKVSDPEEDEVLAFVNGTPITGEMQVNRQAKTEIALFGCGLRHRVSRVSSKKFRLLFNVTIPYMPITTDGKAPDFSRIYTEMAEVIGKASRKLRSEQRQETKQTDILSQHIDAAIRKASGDGEYRFSLRQLYYAVRPYVMERAESGTLDYGYFSRWIGEYENANGEIPGMYRDPRGTLYHPHTGETIPIGTIAVEEYRRPEWTFNKILYIEKEGLFEVLKQVGFPEKYDCALLSSKGFASRAVRDLIDLLGDTGEEIHVFALHDADGPGTAIYEALVEGTLARRARRVKVHNLGLEPWEGVKMGLQVETFEKRKQRVPVAKYITDMWESREGKDGYQWGQWLQENRIELNSMTSPQFVAWLEEKFEAIEAKKIVPPNAVLAKTLRKQAEQQVRSQVAARLLAAGDFEGAVSRRMSTLDDQLDRYSDADAYVRKELDENPRQRWSEPVEKLAASIVGEG